MRPLAEVDTTVWRLAGASKYERNHRGTFAPSTPVSHHMFGWDRKRAEFFVQDSFGIAGTGTNRLPVPVELAELFLSKCFEQAFADRFLNSYCPPNREEETLAHEGLLLDLSCSAYESGRVGRDATLPSLSLSCGSGRLWLFYGLRQSFAERMKKLKSEEVRKNLLPQ